MTVVDRGPETWVVSVLPYSTHLAKLSLRFLICRMGVVITNLQGSFVTPEPLLCVTSCAVYWRYV